ncbi:MAG: hypothetical protein ACR2HM_05615 [Acidimicrobiales bacterium]
MFRAIRKKLFRLVVVGGGGAAAGYFLDRDNGRERRARAKDRAEGLLGRAPAGGSWEPQAEHSANGFEPSVVDAAGAEAAPVAPVAPVATVPTVSGLIVPTP